MAEGALPRAGVNVKSRAALGVGCRPSAVLGMYSLRMGAFGTKVVLMTEVYDPAASETAKRACYVEHPACDPAALTLKSSKYDALSPAAQWDSSLPRRRSARRGCGDYNRSSQMGSLLTGAGETGPLLGAARPPIGQHVMLRDGGHDELAGALQLVARAIGRSGANAGSLPQSCQQQRSRAPYRWVPGWEERVTCTGGACDAGAALACYSDAADVLRSLTSAASFAAGPGDGRSYASLIADAGPAAGSAGVQAIFEAVHEAARAVGFELER